MLKKTFKYLGFFVFICLLSYNTSTFKHFIYEKIWFKSSYQSNEEKFDLYLTSDNALVAISNKVDIKQNEKSHIPVTDKTTLLALEINLLRSYTQLLTFMAIDNYKNNQTIKDELFGTCINHFEYNRHFYGYLSKSYSEIMRDDRFKDKVRHVSANDINLIKKGNVYTIVIHNKVINMVLEMEKVLNCLERRNADVRPERNFLKTISHLKY